MALGYYIVPTCPLDIFANRPKALDATSMFGAAMLIAADQSEE